MTGQRAAWAQVPYESFDSETTGVDVEQDRIVTASLLAVDPQTGSVDKREWLINPGIDIPEAATKVHGITTEHAREHGLPPGEALLQIRDALHACWDGGSVLVVYNAPFDLTMLDRELRRHCMERLGTVGPVYDPLVADKRINLRVRGKGARRLMATCARNGITLSEQDAHSSSGDALAAARLAWKQAAHPQVRGIERDDLTDRLKSWYEAQQESFADWLGSKEGGEMDAARVRREAALGYPVRAFVDELAAQGDVPW